MAVTVGHRLGVYEVLAPLGAGGMGEVYRARDTRLGRDVAIKVLPASFAGDTDRLMRFEREAKMLAALNHPHIAQIYGLEQSADTLALVMELVDGEDLAARIARGPLPLDEALPLARQIAEALEAAHDQGIVHRDLKPANIQVRPDGTVKVLDFGLAKALGPGPDDEAHAAATITSPAVTMRGTILGTAAYMAPEQAKGKPVDRRADIWAFGCVLYEMLTGRRAFGGEDVTDTISAVLRDTPAWEALPTGTPPTVRTLLERCLRKDPARRLASAADARLEIEEAFDDTGRRSADGPGVSPRRSPLFAAAAVAAIVAALGAYGLGTRAGAPPVAAPGATRFVIHPPAGTDLVSGHRELALSADGQQVAFIARGAAGQHVYLRRLDALEPAQVPGTDGARDLAFSPDGQWLAFHAGSKIRKVRTDGTLSTVLADAVHSHGLAWHPTEDAVYFAPFELSPLWKVPADGQGAPVQVTTLDTAGGERSHEWPVIVDGGRGVLFAVNANGADLDELVSLLTLASGSRTTVRAGGSPFGLTASGELLLVRDRAVVGAALQGGRLGSPEVRERASALSNPVVSPSGTLAYVPAADYRRRSIAWYSPGGAMADAGFGRRAFGDVALSPDGRRVAITVFDDGDWALFVADAAGGTLTPLSSPSPSTPVWSPDGAWVAGAIPRAGSAQRDVARVAAPIGRGWEVLASGSAEDVVSQWTPDGRALLFSRRDSPTGRRAPMRLALDNPRATAASLVESTGDHIVQSPALSPDGRWLAYESNESGRLEVYAQSYPVGTMRIQVSRDGGSWPTWTRRGDAIYFAAAGAIMRSDIATQPELRSTAPRPVVTEPLLAPAIAGARPFDVAPDGRVLVIREDDSVRSDHIVIVQNWLGQGRQGTADARR